MKKYYIISPMAPALMELLGKNSEDIQWIQFSCDAGTEEGVQKSMEWILNHKPDYVLVGLTAFNKDDCHFEWRLSRFLEDHAIPAHFRLPDYLHIDDETAARLTHETEIHDLWSWSGVWNSKEILDLIDTYVQLKTLTWSVDQSPVN